MDASQLESLITRYATAWGEANDDKRKQHLEAVWEVQGVYTDPVAHAPGREALNNLIAGFQAQNPGTYFELAGAIEHHHQHLRFFWKMRRADGTELPGMDYGEVSPDGKLMKIVGFFQT